MCQLRVRCVIILTVHHGRGNVKAARSLHYRKNLQHMSRFFPSFFYMFAYVSVCLPNPNTWFCVQTDLLLVTAFLTLSNSVLCKQLWLEGGRQIESSLSLSFQLQTYVHTSHTSDHPITQHVIIPFHMSF